MENLEVIFLNLGKEKLVEIFKIKLVGKVVGEKVLILWELLVK